MKYLICVDAGGTKSAACAIALEKPEILHSAAAGAGNLSVQPEVAQENICRAVAGCCLEQKPCAIVIGAAGLSGFSDASAFCRHLEQRFGCPALLISDAQLGLYAAFAGGDGVLCIAGTGSIVYGKRGDRVARCGGWGHLLGDEGGGCAIALDALRAMVRCHDSGIVQPGFAAEILAQTAARTPAELPGFVYRVSKTEIASLAPAVERACAQGDACAQEILTRQGALLAKTALQVCENLQCTAPHLLPMGSVLVKCAPLFASFSQSLLAALPGAEILAPVREFVPQMGGYYAWNAQRS